MRGAYYQDQGVTLYHGDCLEVMAEMEENSVDTIVTDPPYGLEFMGKEWDKLGADVEESAKSAGGFGADEPTNVNAYAAARIRYGKDVGSMQAWHCRWAEAALRVARPGAMLLAFGGTRTHHRLMCAIEDAGWEIRDVVMWLYGSGFPKSYSISKALDKAAGAEREVVGEIVRGDVEQAKASGVTMAAAHANRGNKAIFGYGVEELTLPSTDAAKLWDGWGTALKPAWEPIVVAMKPRDGTFAQNALKWGVAGLWIDGARVQIDGNDNIHAKNPHTVGGVVDGRVYGTGKATEYKVPTGRWPANVIHDGSDKVMRLFPQAGGGKFAQSGKRAIRDNPVYGKPNTTRNAPDNYGDSGSAARFFYCAKASRKERSESNRHPTVKPLALMRYLCRLTKTPTGGVVLDPFAGSGSTLLAAGSEGREAIGIEIDEGYCKIAVKRLTEQASKWRQRELDEV